MIEEAADLARRAHAGQTRKWSEGVAYIVHPERVANKVATLSFVRDVHIAAAWMHDVIEDCLPQYAVEIKDNFPLDVYLLVKELTFPTEGAEWHGRPRAEKNKIRFQHMREMSRDAQRIKMVDRWDNLLDMKNAPYKLISKTVDESYTLLEICRAADPEMAKELADVIEKVKKGRFNDK
jgi:(p)ppGpp synthase/HD superfamily hydrolase